MKVPNDKVDYCGIDVSKSSLDVYYKGHNYVFSNCTKGFKQLFECINDHAWCVMEATGPYYLNLAVFLHSRSIRVSVVNPLVIKRFSQMRMIRAKTDKADAQLIASYAEIETLILWNPPSRILHELQQIQTVIESLMKQRRMMKNQLSAISVQPFQSKEVLNTLNSLVDRVNVKLDKLEQQVLTILDTYFNDEVKLITSIPGLGLKTAAAILIATNGFTKFDSSKQLVSYAGLCPRIYQSGSSIRGKGHITKMGGERLRSTLYLAAWSAIKYNASCKAIYERLLNKGKAKKLALIAVANKLLRQAFAIVKNQESYNETKYYSEFKVSHA